MKIDSRLRIGVRSVPLAACVVAALAIPRAECASAALSAQIAKPPASRALDSSTLEVTSCLDDGGPGTLRSVVAAATSGDTVDMSQLTCGAITLESGAIVVAVDDLTLQGPGANVLPIDGAYAGRVVVHQASGTLTINDLSIVHGHYASGLPAGGCIYATGTLDVNRSTISGCSTAGDGAPIAAGGALVVISGDLAVADSTISDNTVVAAGSGKYVGGGFFVSGNATIVNSTISGNSVVATSGSNGYHAYGGGLVVYGTLLVQNSTIAFNSAGRGGGGIFGLGYPIELDSTIVANNSATYSGYFSGDIGGYGSLTGSNDLIVASDLAVPPDTLDADPLLLALASNGGATATHALDPASPALDAGSNPAGLSFDQRGTGYLRVSGLAPDIGAFEYQQTFAVPTVSKNFSPGTVAVATPSTLTITLTNANALDATLTAGLVDPLPDSVVVANPSDATTDCIGGSVTADAGGNSVTLAPGAAIPARASCTVTVAVTSDDAGVYTNTIPPGALQTDAGTYTSAANANLEVTAAAPALGLAFAPDTIPADATSTLTITLTNANPVDATLTADLDDALPGSLSVAGSAASTTCLGGSVAADPGATTVTLAAGAQIPANGDCTLTVTIAALIPGQFTNTIAAGALATNLGANTAAALATLNVGTAERIFADGFDGTPPLPSADPPARGHP